MIKIKTNIILVNQNKVLIIKRRKKDGGFWQTITGTVEGNENLEETMRREVEEEIGIKEIGIDPSPIYFFIWKKKDNDILEPVFLAQTLTEKVVLGEEHDEYQWVSLEEAKKIVKTKNNKKAIEKAIDKIG